MPSIPSLRLGAALLLVASLPALSGAAASAAIDSPPQPEKKKTRVDEPSAAALMAQAKKAFQQTDLPKAALKLEALLKDEPTNRDALVLLAKVKEDQAMVLAAQELARFSAGRRTREEGPRAPQQPAKNEKSLFAMMFYYEAATYAVGKQPEKAVASLADAYKVGFADVDVVDLDEELDAVANRPDFQKLRKQIEERAVPIVREHAAELLASNKPFPFSFKLPDLDGKKLALGDLKGKVTIVDVWGTWCPPCRMEVLHFIKLYDRFHAKGLEIVGINYEREDDDAKAKEVIRGFLKKNGVPYRCVLGDEKTEKLIPDFQGFPTTLFVGRDGKVRLKAVGYHSLIDLEAVVTRLLDEAPVNAP